MKRRNIAWKDRNIFEKIALILFIPILLLLIFIYIFDLTEMYNFIYQIIGIELICIGIIKNRTSMISYVLWLLGVISIILGFIL